MADCKEKLYPNCAMEVFLRSCEQEITSPLHGKTTGQLPSWLNGTLVRNGPGSTKVGSMRFKHVFDGPALLHRFTICEGTATYQCRFIQTNAFKRNQAAQRIVVSEFGTAAVPDPCHTIFDRVAAYFNPADKLSDNTLVSVYPFGDEIYTFTETPLIHRIDPKTLETLERKDLSQSIAIVNHSAHPHVMANGDVINMGLSITKRGPQHVIIKFPYSEKGDMFEKAHIVGRMKPRWQLHPSYMHSFGITDNYFVFIEQPMSISFSAVSWNILFKRAFASSLRWYPGHETNIVLVSRTTRKEVKRFCTDALFFFHIINAFERDQKLIVDICAYKDAKVVNATYVKAMETMQNNHEYGDWFRCRPKRLEMSLEAPNKSKIQPKMLADISCDPPRIHYEKYNGRPYRYFYALCTEVDVQSAGGIIKVDTDTGEKKVWYEADCFSSEPVFIPEPGGEEEDAGVVLCALLWGSRECSIGLLVLDARTLQEVGRVVFDTPSPAAKCIHGWFLPDRV